MWYVYTKWKITQILKKERIPVIFTNMNRTERDYSKLNKPDIEKRNSTRSHLICGILRKKMISNKRVDYR